MTRRRIILSPGVVATIGAHPAAVSIDGAREKESERDHLRGKERRDQKADRETTPPAIRRRREADVSSPAKGLFGVDQCMREAGHDGGHRGRCGGEDGSQNRRPCCRAWFDVATGEAVPAPAPGRRAEPETCGTLYGATPDLGPTKICALPKQHDGEHGSARPKTDAP